MKKNIPEPDYFVPAFTGVYSLVHDASYGSSSMLLLVSMLLRVENPSSFEYNSTFLRGVRFRHIPWHSIGSYSIQLKWSRVHSMRWYSIDTYPFDKS